MEKLPFLQAIYLQCTPLPEISRVNISAKIWEGGGQLPPFPPGSDGPAE